MSREGIDKKKIRNNFCEEGNGESEEYNEVNEGILCSANFEELKNSMMI